MPPTAAACLTEAQGLRTLEQVVRWIAGLEGSTRIADIITQDEYTHDVVVQIGEEYLVFDTT